MSLHSWLDDAAKNSIKLTKSEFLSISSLISELYKVLRPVVSSARVKSDSLIDSDFSFVNFYQDDKYNNPDKYFCFQLGLVRIEIYKVRSNYCVRSYNWEFIPDFGDDVSKPSNFTWFSRSLSKTFVFSCGSKIPISAGWFVYGDFVRSDWLAVVELFHYLVNSFLSQNNFYYNDNVVNSSSVKNYIGV